MKRREEIIRCLLLKQRLVKEDTPLNMQMLSGDGSDRVFFRITIRGQRSYIAVFPSLYLAKGSDEQVSAYRIGVHLYDKGVPVPEIFCYDKENGLIVFEDLGECHLQSLVCKAKSFAEIESLYHQAIVSLVRFQIEGRQQFDSRFCWDTPCYDEKLMLERESGYFSSSFCKDYMGKIADDHGLVLDFQRIARRAGEQDATYLLHRDFQSRNLMIHEERVRIIDYQGARFGPLGYDIASLLLDPYAGLDDDAQQAVLSFYLNELSHHIPLDTKEFLRGYYCLALQRNLQILGAFAFLSQIKGKVFFEQFIFPALTSLQKLLSKPEGKEYPVLGRLVLELKEKLVASQHLFMTAVTPT
ncbi:MAG: phosphotransferase [Desulfobulbaceae bacterium]|nr:phosphotransferase [Desulfobulbaceae bacterium]